ncbi:hypothetical protein GALMADRAFT_148180 [Galerina marginata CBS 339.88]|uniref:Uncharacterized protein n=1 Tax=Galerina marginata (strain CBS 339.88) TaxID=685588 RepID=A0A067S7V5_GALM3|nr:hypothetical protein GALMADRAFT_148180 [Galerina marginata CBS 339.88]
MSTRSQLNSDDQSIVLRVPADLPPGACEIILEGRSPLLPTLYTIPTHPKIPNPTGKIVLVVIDSSAEVVHKIENSKLGWYSSNNDHVLLRDKFGTGKFEDDIVVFGKLGEKGIEVMRTLVTQTELIPRVSVDADAAYPVSIMTRTAAVDIEQEEYFGNIHHDTHDGDSSPTMPSLTGPAPMYPPSPPVQPPFRRLTLIAYPRR